MISGPTHGHPETVFFPILLTTIYFLHLIYLSIANSLQISNWQVVLMPMYLLKESLMSVCDGFWVWMRLYRVIFTMIPSNPSHSRVQCRRQFLLKAESWDSQEDTVCARWDLTLRSPAVEAVLLQL